MLTFHFDQKEGSVRENELVIPRRIERWARESPEIASLLDSTYGTALLQAYRDLDCDLLYRSVTHGVGHIERTMLFGALIAKNEQLSARDTRDVLLCCSYHDIGRIDDRYDLEHGKRSAEQIRESETLRALFSYPEEAMAAIHSHAVPDGETEGIPDIYGVKDPEKYALLTACLKDADNIDRVRIYDLDESFLRFAGTRRMVPLAWWVLDEYLRTHTVLCFGDSNTFGYNPRTGGRYPSYFRYPSVLARFLGEDYTVIDEGLNGRTTAFPLDGVEWLSGLYAIRPAIAAHYPVDTLVIMLGTNDCAVSLGLSAEEITHGMEKLIRAAQAILLEKQGAIPRIILICPPHIEESVWKGPFAENMDRRSLEVSAALPGLYEELARKTGCDFLNLDGVLRFSELDSEHLRPFDNYRLAGMLAERIRRTEKE